MGILSQTPLQSMSSILRSFFIIALLGFGCQDDTDQKPTDTIQLTSIKVGGRFLDLDSTIPDIPLDQPIILSFNMAVEEELIQTAISLTNANDEPEDFLVNLLDNSMTASLALENELAPGTVYDLTLKEFTTSSGAVFEGKLTYSFQTEQGKIALKEIRIDDQLFDANGRTTQVSLQPSLTFTFTGPVVANSEHVQLRQGSLQQTFTLSSFNGDSSLRLVLDEPLKGLSKYRFSVSDELASPLGYEFEGYSGEFYTQLDPTLKFPQISDDELLTKVQMQTFRYFWNFGHPTSGMARERNTSGHTVTTGGSGFGMMAILIGIERGFVTRTEGVTRLTKVVDFLSQADRYHGVWSHWMDGTTGKTIPFSSNDDGGDLVETAFMIQGLLTVRQYLDQSQPEEAQLIEKINALWHQVEWTWYQQDAQQVLYWHWSPRFGWEKNLRISGWNESLIVYVLAASSPTFAIDKEVYTQGWARNAEMANGRMFYDITLPLGPDLGGPLFFSHYSFLGLDPRMLADQYGNYWDQNVNHSMINLSYCKMNPRGFVGYSESCWGLTASDNHQGYSAHSPSNDLGVITPTAAISAMPYTTEASMAALRHFYYMLGDRLWGEYGFYDAFNPTESWFADSYLAIDQGPIICMIENHRTGLLWDLFMSAPEVQLGLDKLGFTY